MQVDNTASAMLHNLHVLGVNLEAVAECDACLCATVAAAAQNTVTAQLGELEGPSLPPCSQRVACAYATRAAPAGRQRNATA